MSITHKPNTKVTSKGGSLTLTETERLVLFGFHVFGIFFSPPHVVACGRTGIGALGQQMMEAFYGVQTQD